MTRILIAAASLFGANEELAKRAARVFERTGVATRVRRAGSLQDGELDASFPEACAEDLEWADGYVFASPSHTGLLAAPMKQFIDAHHDAALAGHYLNKSFTAMATSGFAHAGQERVVDNLNAVAAAWGCVIVAPSTANPELNRLNGNPFGLSFVLDHGKVPESDAVERVMTIHFERFVAVTEALTSVRGAGRQMASGD